MRKSVIHRPIFLPVVLLCCTLLLPLAAARGAEDGCAGVRGEFTASRGFSGSVRRAQAESAALAAALLSAYEYAGHMLSAEYVPDFPDAAARLGVPGEALFEGLACALFPARRLEARVDGFPPNLRVTVGVVLGDPGASTPAEALKDADRLESGRRMVVRLRAELARYDVAADKLLGRRPDTPEDGEATRALRWAAERMKALEILRDILSRCGQEDPHRLDEELAEALRLAPDDPLLLTLSAGNRLLLDSPAGALEQADAALVLAPDFARAHDTRGVALMRQGLPSLAADAFGRASALAPDNPAYLVHRASACFVLKEKKGMCADFRAACSLGDCEGLTWALDAGECPRF